MGDACALVKADAVVGAVARREERFPRYTSRIIDPRLFRFGIAAGRLALLDDVLSGLAKARVNILQFTLAFDLNTKMIEAGLCPLDEMAKFTCGSSSIHLA